MKRLLSWRPALFLVLTALSTARAEVALPALFSEHAVLQKAARVPVWGSAAPGETVTVSLAGETKAATAGADGAWRVELNLADKGPGPFDLVVEGKNRLTVSDVLIGEVWLCSGQSNMQFVLRDAEGAPEEIAASADPQLRQFRVANAFSPTPLPGAEGKWVIAGPATSGGFTAVGYYFGKLLRKELGVPVGLVNSSWGGTPVEAWTSLDALLGDPGMKEGAEADRKYAAEFPARAEAQKQALQAWEKQYRREVVPADPAAYADPAISTADWKPVTLPGALAEQKLPDAGAIWVRRKVTIPAPLAGQTLSLVPGLIQDFDAVYLNGVKVGETPPPSGGASGWRRYYVPGKAGEAVVAIRISAPAGGAAIRGPQFQLGPIPLAGEWLAKAEAVLPPPDAAMKAAYPRPLPAAPELQNVGAYLYAAMVHPLVPYAMRGAIWYQGEANAPRAFQYRTAFPLLIRDWRARWGEGDFPFYFCQLPNYGARKTVPQESAWAELREGQARALALPNTGAAVLIDLGEEGNVHPRDKKSVGERLVKVALAGTYGRPIVSSGPVYESMSVQGDTAVVRFSHADDGLAAHALPATYRPSSLDPTVVPLVRNSPESEVEGFAVCGSDRKWAWADAKIDGETVGVRAAAVPQPVAVRYAWADCPTCNLYNGAGLPAAPFRTDDFPLITEPKRYGH